MTDVSKMELVAQIDNSEHYSIDVIEVYRNGTGYFVRTASGCSCWDGEYQEFEFTSLGLLAVWLFQSDTQWQPSINQSLQLLKEIFDHDA